MMFNLSRINIRSIFHGGSYIVMNSSSVCLRVRCISKISSESDSSQSFVISYLANKCGFSQKCALAASKHVSFKTPDNPDSVIAFLEKHGLPKTQIQEMIRVRPSLLTSNVEKVLLPKFEFFRSKNFSNPDLIKYLSYNSKILARSLEKHIIPCFNHFRSLLQSDVKAAKAIKRYPYLLSCNFDACVAPNINVLLDNGVTESYIRQRFLSHPRTFVMIPDRFKEIVKKVKEIGFDPSRMKFLHAVAMFRKMSNSTLQRKFDVYKKWGWSEQQCWEAFRRYPNCMEPSDEKIMAIMDFVVNEMGFQSSLIASQPKCLCGNSLEKRIVPRGLFVRELLSKGLIEKIPLSGLCDGSDEAFLQRFVDRYEDKAPELLKLYNEKMNLAIGGKYRICRM